MTQVKYHENKVKTRENKCKYMKIHMKTQSIARGHISDEKRPKTAGRGAQTVVPYSKMLNGQDMVQECSRVFQEWS
jgi:hypothetical protein